MWHVYLLQCSDGSLYVGRSQDLAQRIEKHNRGSGALFTSRRRPVALVYSEPASDEFAAARRERQIKNWSIANKKALICGDHDALHSASRCHDVHGQSFSPSNNR